MCVAATGPYHTQPRSVIAVQCRGGEAWRYKNQQNLWNAAAGEGSSLCLCKKNIGNRSLALCFAGGCCHAGEPLVQIRHALCECRECLCRFAGHLLCAVAQGATPGDECWQSNEVMFTSQYLTLYLSIQLRYERYRDIYVYIDR